jgi:excisionase family DNA binding protein
MQKPAASQSNPAGAGTVLLTPDEVAALLRTSRKAVYAMVERRQLPGVIRIGRRVLICEDALIDWLRQKSTPSLGR